MAKNLCGHYILETTNTNLPNEEVEKNYKQLKYVEKAFRELKEIVEIRPKFMRISRRKGAKLGYMFCILCALCSQFFLKIFEFEVYFLNIVDLIFTKFVIIFKRKILERLNMLH